VERRLYDFDHFDEYDDITCLSCSHRVQVHVKDEDYEASVRCTTSETQSHKPIRNATALLTILTAGTVLAFAAYTSTLWLGDFLDARVQYGDRTWPVWVPWVLGCTILVWRVGAGILSAWSAYEDEPLSVLWRTAISGGVSLVVAYLFFVVATLSPLTAAWFGVGLIGGSTAGVLVGTIISQREHS
jgi:hypothetical protein